MTLAKCPGCGNSCSSLAVDCPHCNRLLGFNGEKTFVLDTKSNSLSGILKLLSWAVVIFTVVYTVACVAEQPACLKFEFGCTGENYEKAEKWREKYLWFMQ